MAKLSLIDLKIGLPANPYVSDGQKKWKLISKKCGQNGHSLAQNRPTATLARDLLMGHFDIFFLKLLVFSRQIEW